MAVFTRLNGLVVFGEILIEKNESIHGLGKKAEKFVVDAEYFLDFYVLDPIISENNVEECLGYSQ